MLQTLLAVAPRPTGDGGPSYTPLIMMGLIFAVFYFILIAPARKKQKKHTEMLDHLKNGDKIITNGGIHGTVVGVSENVIQIRIAEKVKIDVSKQAVAALLAPPEA